MKTRTTLRDVAKRAGCSAATVSMALHGSPRLSEATRLRVRKAAKDLGYRFDPVLSALAAYRWQRAPRGMTLAVLADGDVEGWPGMLERATAHGYRLDLFQIRDTPDPQRLAGILTSRGIVGLVVSQVFHPGFCAAFDWSRFTAVACSEGFERPPVHLVMPNHFKAVQDAWTRARSLGYKRIGLAVFDMPAAIDFHDRCAAFLEQQRGVPAARRLPILTVPTWSGAPAKSLRQSQQALKAWMRRYRPDVVLGFNSAFRWLMEDGGWLRPGKSAFLDLWVSTPDPAATGMRLYADEIGRRALDWLDSLLRSGERGIPAHPATMAIDFSWQEGTPAGRGRPAP